MSNSNEINKKRKCDNSCTIIDPRRDSAAVAMRSKRAISVYKKLKTYFDKSDYDNTIQENKLTLQKTDIAFYNEFINSSEAIKQELIYLWEEVGHLNEELDRIEDIINSSDKVNIPVSTSNVPAPPVPISDPIISDPTISVPISVSIPSSSDNNQK